MTRPSLFVPPVWIERCPRRVFPSSSRPPDGDRLPPDIWSVPLFAAVGIAEPEVTRRRCQAAYREPS